MEKNYRVVITDIDAEKVVLDEQFASVAMVAGCVENPEQLAEVILNDSIAHIATKIASSEKMSRAARFAVDMMNARASGLEELLMKKLANIHDGGEDDE